MPELEPVRNAPGEKPVDLREASMKDWVPSEQSMMGDGQLGSDLLDGGPDGCNPEGTAGIDKPCNHTRFY